MKNLKFVVILALLTGMAFFFSCRDDDQLSDEFDSNLNNSIELDSRSDGYGSFDMTVTDGIVYFTDENHAQSMMNLLESRYDAASSTVTFDELDFYRSVQNEIGFQSLLVLELEEEERKDLEGYTLVELEAYEDSRFIFDDLERFFVNSDYEVGLGTNVLVYYGPNKTFTVENGDKDVLGTFQNLKRPGNDFPEIVANPNVSMEYGNVNITHVISEPDIDDNTNTTIDWRMDRYILTFITNNVDCEVYEKTFYAKLEREFNNDNGTPDNDADDYIDYEPWIGDFTLTLGDGSSQSIIGESEFFILYEYANTGSFTVTVSVDFFDIEDEFMSMQESRNIRVESSCTEQDASESERVYNTDGNRRMHNEIWFKHGGLFGSSKAGAKTHSWRRKSNGKWKREKAALRVYIDADFLNSNCQLDANKRETDTCGNCKRKRCQRSNFASRRDIANGGVFSEHRADFGSHGIVENTLVLNPCQ